VRRPKLAFLFLTCEGIQHAALWDRFFQVSAPHPSLVASVCPGNTSPAPQALLQASTRRPRCGRGRE